MTREPDLEGFSILAARVLLSQIGTEQLTVERLAYLLESVLQYPWMIRMLLSYAVENPYYPGSGDENAKKFERWVQLRLLGYPPCNDKEEEILENE